MLLIRNGHAILLVAGDKSGVSQKKFYKRLIAKADSQIQTTSGATEGRREQGQGRGRSDEDFAREAKSTSPLRDERRLPGAQALLVAEEMTMRELREARRSTQAANGKDSRHKPGADLSALKSGRTCDISTLKRAVEAMGGKLDLIRHFPSGAPIRLTGLRSLSFQDCGGPLIDSPATHPTPASARSHTIACRRFLSRTRRFVSSSRCSSRSKVIFAGWKFFASAWQM